MTTKLTLFSLLNEEILEPIRVSRNISVVYNLSVRIAPVYACNLKPLTAEDDLRIQLIFFKLIVEMVTLTTMRCFVEGHQLW